MRRISLPLFDHLSECLFFFLYFLLSLLFSLSLSVYLPLTSCTLRAVFFLPYLATFDSFTNCVGQKRKINARRAGNYQSTIKHPWAAVAGFISSPKLRMRKNKWWKMCATRCTRYSQFACFLPLLYFYLPTYPFIPLIGQCVIIGSSWFIIL